MLRVITPATVEPISLAEVKAQLRLDLLDVSEDTLLASYITSVRQYVEDLTAVSLAVTTYEKAFDYFNCEMELDRTNVTEIVSVKYKSDAGTEITLTANIEYITALDYGIGKITLPPYKTWPSAVLWPVNPIRIQFKTGVTELPHMIKQLMLVHIGYLYKYRDAVIPEAEMKWLNQGYKFHKMGGWF